MNSEQQTSLLSTLKKRFEANTKRHPSLNWTDLEAKLISENQKLWSLNEMEQSGGEPDVIGYNEETDEYLFVDCSAETPKGRRSLCYDMEALESRKTHKPANNAIDVATEMGIELLSEEDYRTLQQHGPFDQKTSSWIATPAPIRALGGALFCDYRYGQVFVYHNGASSYYAARGFRGSLKV
ncbi:hypothetical protein JCM19046_4932 [Bacillus sp. JCM 19046]|nr:hypothetical protein JCM19046_4932 [Bacillus sp. JCM 19046]